MNFDTIDWSGFVTIEDCRAIMEKDEFKRFKKWVVVQPGKIVDFGPGHKKTGMMAYPHEVVAKWFDIIQKPLI